MFTIFVEYFIYQTKINDWVFLSLLIIADVLELEVSVGVSKFMNNFQLRYYLNAEVLKLVNTPFLVHDLVF